MKKFIFLAILTFSTLFAYANPPSGCYQGSQRSHRNRCALHIGGDVLSVLNRDGEVIARWKIVSDKDGVLTLRSEYGASATARWGVEDGEVYIVFNYETYTPYNS